MSVGTGRLTSDDTIQRDANLTIQSSTVQSLSILARQLDPMHRETSRVILRVPWLIPCRDDRDRASRYHRRHHRRTSLHSDEGSVLEAFLGALFVGILAKSLNLLGVKVYWQNLAAGLIVADLINERREE
jgi:hypothetical protein